MPLFKESFSKRIPTSVARLGAVIAAIASGCSADVSMPGEEEAMISQAQTNTAQMTEVPAYPSDEYFDNITNPPTPTIDPEYLPDELIKLQLANNEELRNQYLAEQTRHIVLLGNSLENSNVTNPHLLISRAHQVSGLIIKLLEITSNLGYRSLYEQFADGRYDFRFSLPERDLQEEVTFEEMEADLNKMLDRITEYLRLEQWRGSTPPIDYLMIIMNFLEQAEAFQESIRTDTSRIHSTREALNELNLSPQSLGE